MKLTPKQVAQAIGVSESSMKRWCDRGLIDCEKTVGRHRRISRSSLINFLRNSEYAILRPENLGLPAGTSRNKRMMADAAAELSRALFNGDESQANQVVLESFLSGHSMAEIGDRLIQPALQQFRQGFRNDKSVDRLNDRARSISNRAIVEIRSLLPAPRPEAPLAIGVSVDDSVDCFDTNLIETVFQEIGWQSQSFAPSLPFPSNSAVEIGRSPNLLWLLVTEVDNESEFLERFQQFRDQLDQQFLVVIGGNGLQSELREKMSTSRFADNFQQLQSIATAVASSTGNENGHSR